MSLASAEIADEILFNTEKFNAKSFNIEELKSSKQIFPLSLQSHKIPRATNQCAGVDPSYCSLFNPTGDISGYYDATPSISSITNRGILSRADHSYQVSSSATFGRITSLSERNWSYGIQATAGTQNLRITGTLGFESIIGSGAVGSESFQGTRNYTIAKGGRWSFGEIIGLQYYAVGISTAGGTTNLIVDGKLGFSKLSGKTRVFGFYSHYHDSSPSILNIQVKSTGAIYADWIHSGTGNSHLIGTNGGDAIFTIADGGNIHTHKITSSVSAAYGFSTFNNINQNKSATLTIKGENNHESGGIISFNHIQGRTGSAVFESVKDSQTTIDKVRIYYGDHNSFDEANHRSALYANVTGTYSDSSGKQERNKDLIFAPKLIDTSKEGNLYGMYFIGEQDANKKGTIRVGAYDANQVGGGAVKTSSLSTEGFGTLNNGSTLQSGRETIFIHTEGNLSLVLEYTRFKSGANHNTEGASIQAGNGNAVGVSIGTSGNGATTEVVFANNQTTFAKLKVLNTTGLRLANGSNSIITNLTFGETQDPHSSALSADSVAKGIDFQGTSTLTLRSDLVFNGISGRQGAYGLYASGNSITLRGVQTPGDRFSKYIYLNNFHNNPNSYGLNLKSAENTAFEKVGIIAISPGETVPLALGIHDTKGIKFELGKKTIFKDVYGAVTVGLSLHSNSKLGKDTATLARNTSIALDSQSLIFETIETGDGEQKGQLYGITGGGDIVLSNQSVLYLNLVGTPSVSSPAFFANKIEVSNSTASISNTLTSRTITLNHSLLALNTSNADTKLSSDQHILSLELTKGSTLILGGNLANSYTIDNLMGNGALDLESIQANSGSLNTKNNIIDLSSSLSSSNGGITVSNFLEAPTRTAYKTLTIGSSKAGSQGLSGNNLLFRVYVNPKGDGSGTALVGADKIKVEKGTAGTHYLQANFDKDGLAYVKENGFQKEIVLAEIKSDLKDLVVFRGGASSYIKPTEGINASGASTSDYMTLTTDYSTYYIALDNKLNGGYLQYFIPTKAQLSKGVVSETYLNTTLQANVNVYEVFNANLNSLNKRMGELRDNKVMVFKL